MKRAMMLITLLLVLLAPLAAQKIKVESPNAGSEYMVAGQPWPIEWTATNLGQNVRIVLIKAGGAKVGVVAEDLAPNGSPYSWTIGQTKSGTAPAEQSYRIRVITMDGNLQDVSDKPFTIHEAAKPPVIFHPRPEPMPLPLPLPKPKLAVTTINLVRNASGYGIIFGYKNVGNGALPKRHELTVKPDFRVLIDGREVDKGDLFIPESPPAGPGWEMATHSGGLINFPVNEPRPWYIGKEITIILNERNALNMGSASKTSSLLPIVLAVGYDLAFFGPASIDWGANKASVMITKVGSSPQNSKSFTLHYSIGYYHTNTLHGGVNEGVVYYKDGAYTDSQSREFPITGPFPMHVNISLDPTSPYYDLEFHLYSEERDEFDERDNTILRSRFERPGIAAGPRIHSVSFSTRADSRGKPTQLRTVISLLNEAGHGVGGLRLVLKRDGSTAEEWKGISLSAGQKQLYINYGPLPKPYPPAHFQILLYDGGDRLIDSRSELE